MRILYHFRTQGTGAEGVHIAGIAKAFERLGHEVIFSSPTGLDPRKHAGENPFAEDKRRRSWLRWLARRAPRLVFELAELAYNAVAYRRNARLLQRYNCGMIYERHAFFLFATAWLARRRGIPLVVEVNELAGDERVRADPLLRPLARWADRVVVRQATLVVVVSPHLGRRVQAMGVDPAKVLVLPNAVDEALLKRAVDPGAFRERYGLTGTVVIGFVGWFVPWHRLDRLVREFAALAPGEPRLRLLLLGDGPLREDLRKQAEVLGVADQVVFAGALPHGEIPEALAATDVSVVPHGNAYRSPIKLFEAMAMGCAVVAPRLEPIEMVIQDGENGLLFDPESGQDLRTTLTKAIADQGLRRKMGERARADVRARHTWRRNAEEVLRRIGMLSRTARSPA